MSCRGLRCRGRHGPEIIHGRCLIQLLANHLHCMAVNALPVL
jgi:hypothetical protein